jgi:hypothetical protein
VPAATESAEVAAGSMVVMSATPDFASTTWAGIRPPKRPIQSAYLLAYVVVTVLPSSLHSRDSMSS